jgi:hypothetical protein
LTRFALPVIFVNIHYHKNQLFMRQRAKIQPQQMRKNVRLIFTLRGLQPHVGETSKVSPTASESSEQRYWQGIVFFAFLLPFIACHTEGVKLNREDRIAIDTLSQKEIQGLTVQLDKTCQDSADVLRQRLVDSMVVAREREIMMQTLPNH